ncbi:hypothetical protein [Streptococcus parasanguinis]|uniref:hypothetical protein n=1 Tax=Streptococcus parasanguinis TaxID=1318 RepID=UPI002001ABC8|nr:hypothetical protein [Streptococcus parasanguinis]
MNIFKTIPFNIKKWFLYLLLAFFIAVTLLTCLFFFLIDQEEKKIQQQISGFYQEAGFKGDLHFKEAEFHGLSTKYAYSYQERVEGKTVQFDFLYASLLFKEEIGKNYDTAEELAQHYNSWLVAPFFERAFTESQGFQQLKQEIKERFHQQGLEVSEIRLQLPNQNPDFEDQLAKDLLAAEKAGETDLRGILTLNYATYRQIKGFSFTITVTSLAKEFEGKYLDVSGLPPGNYVIESDSKNEGSYYFEID